MDPGPEVPAEEWAPARDPECAAVGCGGCIDHQTEYPCNCFYCRGALSAVSTAAFGDCYHDGELTWWRCCFCRRYFDLGDMELLSGDGQACEPCVSMWVDRQREAVTNVWITEPDRLPAPGAASLP